MPPVAVDELEQVIEELSLAAGGAVDKLMARLDRLDLTEARAFLADAYPALVEPFLRGAGELAAQWYAEQPAGDRTPGAAVFTPVAAPLPPARNLTTSAIWALTRGVPADALRGSTARQVRNASRDTVTINAEREGVRWVRQAKMNACGFCRMLTVRAVDGFTYADNGRVVDKVDEFGTPTGEKTLVVGRGRKRRKGGRKPGEEYHDHCRCIAIPLRDGAYTAPDYVERWAAEYKDAVKAVGSKDAAKIAREMDRDRVREDRPAPADRNPVAPRREMPRPAPADEQPKPLEPAPGESKADIARRLLPGLEENLAALRAKGLAEDSPQITWHIEQINRLRADLGESAPAADTAISLDAPAKLPSTPPAEPAAPANSLEGPEVAQLPRKSTRPDQSMKSAKKDAAWSNPSWTKPGDKAGSIHYRDNCTHCVTAYEMRRRGYNVEAAPTKVGTRGAGRNTDRDILTRFRYPGATTAPTLKAIPGGRKEELDAVIREYGRGTRGWAVVDWKSGGSHIFAWENINGEPVYIEPQDGSTDASGHFDRIKTGIRYIRTDNLIATDELLNPDDPIIRTADEGAAERKKVQAKRDRLNAKAWAEAQELKKRTPPSEQLLETASSLGFESKRANFSLGALDARTRTNDEIVNKALAMAMSGDQPGSQAYLAGWKWYNETWMPAQKK